jgi:hypothetical protein
MPTPERTLEAMRASPKDWRIADLETVAAAFGVNVRKSGGSHVIFWRSGIREALSVPARRPIKPVYIRRFVSLIDTVRVAGDESKDSGSGRDC